MKRRARERDGLDVDSEEEVKKGLQERGEISSAPKNINFFADIEQGVSACVKSMFTNECSTFIRNDPIIIIL